MKPVERGQSFLQEVLSKIPEDRRAAVADIVEATPELATVIGEGVLRRDEFSREMDRLGGVERDQTTWWNENKDLAEVGRKAKDAGFDPAKPGLTSPALPDDVVRRDDLDRRDREMVNYHTTVSALQFKHLQEFGEVVDLGALLKDPRLGKDMTLVQVYDASVAARRDVAAKARIDKEVTDRVAAGIAEERKKLGNPAYPGGGNVPPGSPLDALKPLEPVGTGVSAYVEAYEILKAGGSI